MRGEAVLHLWILPLAALLALCVGCNGSGDRSYSRRPSLYRTGSRMNMEQLLQDASEMEEEMKALREKKPWLKDYDRGQALFKKGQFQEALDAFDKALAGDATLDVAWVFKGRCVLRLGRPQESIQYFDKAIEVSRSTRSSKSWVWWPYYFKGMALNMLRRYDEALDALTRSIESNETARARLARADVHGRQIKFDLAIKDLDRAIELSPSFIEAYPVRAMALARRCDKAAALKDVAAVEKQQPRMGRILRPQIEQALGGQ
jgi:tetratricopeptide (TPR) repeat protein